MVITLKMVIVGLLWLPCMVTIVTMVETKEVKLFNNLVLGYKGSIMYTWDFINNLFG